MLPDGLIAVCLVCAEPRDNRGDYEIVTSERQFVQHTATGSHQLYYLYTVFPPQAGPLSILRSNRLLLEMVSSIMPRGDGH